MGRLLRENEIFNTHSNIITDKIGIPIIPSKPLIKNIDPATTVIAK